MDLSWMGRSAGKLAAIGFFFATPAAAQPPVWTVTAGAESFWLRDVAKTGRPVDASPVAWEGAGPAIVATHDRGSPGRQHHAEGSFVSVGGFTLQSPVRAVPAPAGDRVRRLAGRYEYRRYPFRDVGVGGLDLGIGAEGNVEHLLFLRHFEPAIDLRSSVTNLGTAAVLAARLHRSRIDIQAAFGNGLSIGRGTSRHRGEVETGQHGWGGGWQTHVSVRAALRVRPRASVVAAYLNSGEGRFASHDAITFGRSRFSVGVAYER